MNDFDPQIIELPELGKRVIITREMIEFYGKDKFSNEDPEFEYQGKIYRAVNTNDWNRIVNNETPK